MNTTHPIISRGITRYVGSISLISTGHEQTKMIMEDDNYNTGSLELKVDGELLALHLPDIIFVESFGNYVKVVSTDKTYLTQITTKGIEAILPEEHFIRIHKSYIINRHCIKKIEHDSLVINDITLPIGKTYKQYILKVVGKDYL